MAGARTPTTADDIQRRASRLVGSAATAGSHRRAPASTTCRPSGSGQGREFFVVVDDITSWHTSDNPLAALVPYVEQAADLGLHIIATADIRNWSFQSQGGGVLGRVVGMQAPVLVLDGRRSHGQIVPGVFADAAATRQGQAAHPPGIEGVLVGWSEPPVLPRRR